MNFLKIAEENKILEVRVGSHLFGTDTPDSDLDIITIFMPPKNLLYGFQKCEVVKSDTVSKDEFGRNTSDAIDKVYYEYRNFCRLALQNNPNILHILFVNDKNILFENEFGKRLRALAKEFPHKNCYQRFIGYAKAQKHKMQIRGEHYNELLEAYKVLRETEDNTVIGQLSDTYPFNVVDVKSKFITVGDLKIEAGVYAKKVRKIIKDRLDGATNRLGLMKKYGYDVKYASNLIHLLREGIELLKTGEIKYPLSFASEILDIKNGKYSIEEILAMSDILEGTAYITHQESTLRENPQSEYIETFVINEIERYLGEQK